MAHSALLLTTFRDGVPGRAATALGAALRDRGAAVQVVDAQHATGLAGRVLDSRPRSPAPNPLALAAAAGDGLLTRVAPLRALRPALAERLGGGRALADLVAADGSAVVVSASPATTVLLGALRAGGALQVPVVAAITELAGLDGWAHPGVDLHLLAYPESDAEVRRIAGPGARVQAVHGLTDAAFEQPLERTPAREALGLPMRGSVVVVAGGRRGRGDLLGATAAALHYGASRVVVLPGANAAARRALTDAHGADERVELWEPTDATALLLAAADALIDTGGGLIVHEARLCDCRAVLYGRWRGPARTAIEAFDEHGLAAVARTTPQLANALVAALAAPPVAQELPERPAAADLVLALV